jgi:NitT/TauT family transport system ATP-binding protein
MTDSPSFLHLNQVDKTYPNGAKVIDGISVKVEEGEFVSLLGPSGCGKSTLLKLVSGLSPITGGSITADGMTPENAREIMSFIFQDATLLPWRTVKKNVQLALELEGMTPKKREEKVDALLKLVKLEELADFYPRQLSGGQRMRVSIARALATTPRLLLMDEPFAALDEMTRDFLNEELLRLRAEQNWTTLFVTHSVAEAVFLSSRILILRAKPGRLEHDVKIDFPFPRTEAFRRSPEYLAKVGEVSEALHSVMVA